MRSSNVHFSSRKTDFFFSSDHSALSPRLHPTLGVSRSPLPLRDFSQSFHPMLSWWDPWLDQNPGGRRCVASLSPSPRSGPFSTCGSTDDLRRRFLLQHLLGLLLGHLSGARPCSLSTIPLVPIYFMVFTSWHFRNSPPCAMR